VRQELSRRKKRGGEKNNRVEISEGNALTQAWERWEERTKRKGLGRGWEN